MTAVAFIRRDPLETGAARNTTLYFPRGCQAAGCLGDRVLGAEVLRAVVAGRILGAESWELRNNLTQTVKLHRWDEIALDKVTEMISRKIVTGEREMLSQVYLKKGALVPMHSHESEQMTYVLKGALKFLINGEEISVREGEVLHIPSQVLHQAEALDDTFELDLFSPIRQDWLDHTDLYFQD